MSRYQTGTANLDFTEARDGVWQWHQLGHMQVCTSLLTDNHANTPPLIFLQAGCPSCRPIDSIKALLRPLGRREIFKFFLCHDVYAFVVYFLFFYMYIVQYDGCLLTVIVFIMSEVVQNNSRQVSNCFSSPCLFVSPVQFMKCKQKALWLVIVLHFSFLI